VFTTLYYVNSAVQNNAHFFSYTCTNIECVGEKNISVCLSIVCLLGGRELSRGRMGYIGVCSFGGHSSSEVYKKPQLGR
jgi:hypothetical protein